jgi:hypothetical protein
MLNKRNLFAILISFLLFLNAFIGPLLIFGQGIAMVLETVKLPVSWTLILTLLFSWTFLYICVRTVMNFDQLRKPLGILFMSALLVVPSALLKQIVGFRYIGDSIVYFSLIPIAFIVSMYLVYLCVRKLVKPEWRYLIGSIVFTLLLIIPIFIKNISAPEILCHSYPQESLLQEKLLLVVTNGKCKITPGIIYPTSVF